MAYKSKRKSCRWRHRRFDDYHYWADDRYGYGHVIRRSARSWQACAPNYGSKLCRTLGAARKWVEKHA